MILFGLNYRKGDGKYGWAGNKNMVSSYRNESGNRMRSSQFSMFVFSDVAQFKDTTR
jgi:hypothetical protein